MSSTTARGPGLLNLRQIEVFRAIMVTGSVRGAADVLFTSQPSISRTLASAEARLGFSLFERIKGRLHPTPEARKLFSEAELLYKSVNRINELARDLSLNRAGVLRLVSSTCFSTYLVPKAVEQLMRLHPGLRIKYQSLTLDSLLPQLLMGNADLAISLAPPQHPNLVVKNLGSSHVVCVLPPGHPLAALEALDARDLQAYPLIGYPIELPLGQIMAELFASLPEPVSPLVEVHSPLTACAMAQAGVGIAIVDPFSISADARKYLTIRPLVPYIRVGVHCAHTRLSTLSIVGKRFLSVFRTVVSDELEILLPAL